MSSNRKSRKYILHPPGISARSCLNRPRTVSFSHWQSSSVYGAGIRRQPRTTITAAPLLSPSPASRCSSNGTRCWRNIAHIASQRISRARASSGAASKRGFSPESGLTDTCRVADADETCVGICCTEATASWKMTVGVATSGGLLTSCRHTKRGADFGAELRW